MNDEWRWLIGLDLVLALWLGMLADAWKGRRMGTWMAIGLLTSVAGLVVLMCLPKLPRRDREADAHGPYRRTDSYGH